MLNYEKESVINFANTFTSVCLSPKVIGDDVVDIVKLVNIHSHTWACRKYGTASRFSFPKFPMWKTLLASPVNLLSEEEISKCENILKDVKNILEWDNITLKIMAQFDKDKGTEEEYFKNRKLRIKMF